MMEFTNPDDLADTASRLGLAGWYAQSSEGDYLGVLRTTDDEWLIGFNTLGDVTFPISIDRIPQ